MGLWITAYLLRHSWRIWYGESSPALLVSSYTLESSILIWLKYCGAQYTQCYHCCATSNSNNSCLQNSYYPPSMLGIRTLKWTGIQVRTLKKYLQFVALNRLFLWGLLHKVRDEDFQCGSSWSSQQISSESRASDTLQHANLPVELHNVHSKNIITEEIKWVRDGLIPTLATPN